jgi:methylenetetrahydrofolate--tRNA-(uracil-5-)-methyltransferase
MGALARHLTESAPDRFQPANINYGLFTELEKKLPRKARRAAYAERSRRELESWAARQEIGLEEIAYPHSTTATQSAEVSA